MGRVAARRLGRAGAANPETDRGVLIVGVERFYRREGHREGGTNLFGGAAGDTRWRTRSGAQVRVYAAAEVRVGLLSSARSDRAGAPDRVTTGAAGRIGVLYEGDRVELGAEVEADTGGFGVWSPDWTRWEDGAHRSTDRVALKLRARYRLRGGHAVAAALETRYLHVDRGVDSTRAWLNRAELGVETRAGFRAGVYGEYDDTEGREDTTVGLSAGWRW